MNDWYDAEQRVERAKELFDQQKWPEALEELRAAVSINPYNGGWFFNIGLTLDELERFDEAIDAYEQALEIDPDDVDFLNHLGTDLARVGRHQSSLKIFERIEKADSSFEPSYCARIELYRQLKDHDKAEEMFYIARQYKDECPDCYYNIGMSLFDRELFDKALHCWQKVLDLDERHPEIHLRTAEGQRAKGKLDKAREHYLLELRQNPGDTETLLDLGELLMELDRLEEAGEKFRRSIELAPEHPSSHYCHGRWLLETDHIDEAITAFLKTLQLDPTYPGAHLHLGRIYFQRQELEKARRHLRNEHLLTPDDPQMMLDLSNLLLDCGETAAAVVCLKRLTEKEPTNANAWQNLAVAYFHSDCYDQGIAASQEALLCDPGHLMAMYNLAVAFEQLRRYEESLTWIRAGLALDPREPAFQKLELRLRFMQLRAKVGGIFRKVLRGRSVRRGSSV
jgi:tetratricopeptide (TPR) repeat protein